MITALRRALGERRGEHRFIMTVPGRGYRFVAQVRLQTPEPEKAPAAPASSNREPPPRASIAVLPFTNMTGESDKEYFADGLSDEVIHNLARMPGLKVAARTSSFAYKGRNVHIRDIARDLGVSSILEAACAALASAFASRRN